MTLTWIKSQLWAVYKSTARAHKINIYKSLSWQWWSCLQSQKLGGWGTFTGSKLAPVQCDMPAPKTSTQLRTLSLGAVFKDRVADYSYPLRTKQIRTQEADRNHSSLQPGVVAHTLVTAALKRGGQVELCDLKARLVYTVSSSQGHTVRPCFHSAYSPALPSAIL